MKKISLGGIDLYPFQSKEQLLIHLDGINDSILFAVNARKLITSSPELKQVISNNIGYIDGKGAIWAAKRKGIDGYLSRMPGVELWLDIINRYTDKRLYLIGAKQSVIESTVKKLIANYPGINIAGYRNGYFSQESIPEIIQEIKESKAEIIFIALGSPKQEELMIEIQKHHKGLYMGLGGSFDVYSGTVKRAPLVFQKAGMEGLYRLLTNPTRLFDRKIFYGEYFYKLLFNKL